MLQATQSARPDDEDGANGSTVDGQRIVAPKPGSQAASDLTRHPKFDPANDALEQPSTAEKPEALRQLWLDVVRPPQRRPRRKAGKTHSETPLLAVQTDRQFELEMVSRPPDRPAPVIGQAKPRTQFLRSPSLEESTTFAGWLLDQGKQSGTLGELARAAKLDRLFPKTGSADDVRARFSAAGADGDAFEALDDAERIFDRLQ